MMNELVSSTEALVVFNEAKSQITEIAKLCDNVVVNSVTSLSYAKDLVKKSSTIEKTIEKQRKDLTAPILQEKRQIDEYAKKLTEDLTAAIKGLRSQILRFEVELEKARQEELRRIEEAKREELRIADEARKAAEASGEVPEIPVESTINSMVLDNRKQELEADKSKAIRKVWKYEITNENEIPREYLEINHSYIKNAIAAGTREIPGVKIYQADQLVIR
ncbi:MAG: hypothetical protein M9949_14360 [Candidatus Kapabacteria bacterium]|nr:hypothetical protein [Candidatus Kapabacteria bacterium]